MLYWALAKVSIRIRWAAKKKPIFHLKRRFGEFLACYNAVNKCFVIEIIVINRPCHKSIEKTIKNWKIRKISRGEKKFFSHFHSNTRTSNITLFLIHGVLIQHRNLIAVHFDNWHDEWKASVVEQQSKKRDTRKFSETILFFPRNLNLFN